MWNTRPRVRHTHIHCLQGDTGCVSTYPLLLCVTLGNADPTPLVLSVTGMGMGPILANEKGVVCWGLGGELLKKTSLLDTTAPGQEKVL